MLLGLIGGAFLVVLAIRIMTTRPDEVAVVTCDDHAWLEAFSPRLTTIDLPKRELGAAAARLLVDRIARPGGRARIVRLRNALRVRESCGCALRGADALAR